MRLNGTLRGTPMHYQHRLGALGNLVTETIQVAHPARPLQFANASVRAEERGGHIPLLALGRSRGSKRMMPRHSEAGAVHPALPAVIFLVSIAVFAAAIAPIDFTATIRRFFPIQYRTVPHQNAAVWVVESSGVYYCAGSIMFGKASGHYMKQVEALDRGYQPALGTYCTGPEWGLPSQVSPSPQANSSAPPPKAPLTPVGENPFERTPSQKQQGKPWNPVISH